MSLVIFFGMALCIFTVGLVVIVTTLVQWKKLKKNNQEIPSWKNKKTQTAKAQTQDENSLEIESPN